jgi:hypothetical protein
MLQVLGSSAVGAAIGGKPMLNAIAQSMADSKEFFVLIHAYGAWDVTLWADPRNEPGPYMDPATEDNVDTDGLRLWQTISAANKSFRTVTPAGSSLRLGPGIGALSTMASRLTILNGIAMNTVSHPDGSAYSLTGRHLAGGRTVSSTIDAVLAHEFGTQRLIPSVSVGFNSIVQGSSLDPRATPVRVNSIGTVGRVLTRSERYDATSVRDLVHTVLTAEAQELAARSYFAADYEGAARQQQALAAALQMRTGTLFDSAALQRMYGTGADATLFTQPFFRDDVVNAAFAVEAFKSNISRCVSFGVGSFDTHTSNYQDQPMMQQCLFDLIAAMVRWLDAAPHPDRSQGTLGAHTHILVMSEFCRTPQINLSGGRDHYPNNSALIISPKFRGNRTFGRSDPDELLPVSTLAMPGGGMRAMTPPDVLATFLKAFGVEPRRHLRDGEVMPEMLVNP